MNGNIEKTFIENYIINNMQERAKYALNNAKKREAFIWNLFNKNYLDLTNAQNVTIPITCADDLYVLLKNVYGFPDSGYVISINSQTDGNTMLLQQAVRQNAFLGPFCLMSPDGGMIYAEGEPDGKVHERYVIHALAENRKVCI